MAVLSAQQTVVVVRSIECSGWVLFWQQGSWTRQQPWCSNEERCVLHVPAADAARMTTQKMGQARS